MESSKKIDVVYILSEKSSGSSFLFRSLNDALGITAYDSVIKLTVIMFVLLEIQRMSFYLNSDDGTSA